MRLLALSLVAGFVTSSFLREGEGGVCAGRKGAKPGSAIWCKCTARSKGKGKSTAQLAKSSNCASSPERRGACKWQDGSCVPSSAAESETKPASKVMDSLNCVECLKQGKFYVRALNQEGKMTMGGRASDRSRCTKFLVANTGQKEAAVGDGKTKFSDEDATAKCSGSGRGSGSGSGSDSSSPVEHPVQAKCKGKALGANVLKARCVFDVAKKEPHSIRGALSEDRGFLPAEPIEETLPRGTAWDQLEAVLASIPQFNREPSKRGDLAQTTLWARIEALPAMPTDTKTLPDKYLTRAQLVLGAVAYSWVNWMDKNNKTKADLFDSKKELGCECQRGNYCGELPPKLVETWNGVFKRLHRGRPPCVNPEKDTDEHGKVLPELDGKSKKERSKCDGARHCKYPQLWYTDWHANNYRPKNKADRTNKAAPVTQDSIELLINLIEKDHPSYACWQAFFRTFIAMTWATRKVPVLAVEIQEAVAAKDDARLVKKLGEMRGAMVELKAAFNRMRQPKSEAEPYSMGMCDPEKFVAMRRFIVANQIEPAGASMSGLQFPVMQVMDALLGRARRDTGMAKQSLYNRHYFLPVNHRHFIYALEEQRPTLREYVQGQSQEDNDVAHAYNQVIQAFAGGEGFLGTHASKAAGFLQPMGAGETTSGGTTTDEVLEGGHAADAAGASAHEVDETERAAKDAEAGDKSSILNDRTGAPKAAAVDFMELSMSTDLDLSTSSSSTSSSSTSTSSSTSSSSSSSTSSSSSSARDGELLHRRHRHRHRHLDEQHKKKRKKSSSSGGSSSGGHNNNNNKQEEKPESSGNDVTPVSASARPTLRAIMEKPVEEDKAETSGNDGSDVPMGSSGTPLVDTGECVEKPPQPALWMMLAGMLGSAAADRTLGMVPRTRLLYP